jgi:hypothetical protein
MIITIRYTSMASCRLICLVEGNIDLRGRHLVPRADLSGPSSSYTVTLAMTLESSVRSTLRAAAVEFGDL